jgi:hypothetical protein
MHVFPHCTHLESKIYGFYPWRSRGSAVLSLKWKLVGESGTK